MPPKATINPNNPETGTFPPPSGPGVPVGVPFQVQSYSVQASFDLSTTRIPTSFTIILSPDPKEPGFGVFWSNRTPEATAAIVALLEKSLAAGQAIYFDSNIGALGVEVTPNASLIGPKNVIPSN